MDELARINNDMKNLLNSTEIITVFLDNELRVRRFTTGANKLFKLIPGDVGRPLTDIVSDLVYQDFPDDAREVLRTLVFSEKHITTTDGRWFSVRIMPYRTQENMIDGVVMTFSDISSAKKLEAELRETGNMFHTLIQAASFIIVCLSDEGRILEFNPEAERLLGRKRTEVLGQDFFELFILKGDRSQPTGMKEMMTALPAADYTTLVEAANGELLSIQWSTRQILDAAGNSTGIVAIGQDITGRTQAHN